MTVTLLPGTTLSHKYLKLKLQNQLINIIIAFYYYVGTKWNYLCPNQILFLLETKC